MLFRNTLPVLSVLAAAGCLLALPRPGVSQEPERYLAGGPDCATRLPHPRLQAQVEVALGRLLRWPQVRARRRNPVTIPVYFHVVNQGPGVQNGDVPRGAIEQQVRVLNNSYAGLTGGAPTRFRFALAGITRTTNREWFAMESDRAEIAMKQKLRVGGVTTLNVYTCSPPDYLGWSTMAWDYRSDPAYDGVVIKHTTVPGGSEPGKSLGDMAVHEAGHWLGLYHTFQGGCSRTNDQVADTPAERLAGSGWPRGRDSCTGPQFPGPDPIDNFMDYSVDECRHRFTAGQSARMDLLAFQHRGL